MAGTKRSSSASDEEGQDHPASAGPRSSPSAIDNTTETLAGPPITGSSNVVTPRKDEIEQHVDANLDASRTHQCDKAPLSESQNTLRKSEGEDVNAHPNVSGATQCDEPSSSGSSNLSVKSEGEHVDVNPNVSEAPSSSSSTGVTKPDVIRRIKHIDQADGEKVDVNLDELVDHISELLKLREEEMLPNKKASNHSNFRWPEGLKKLNDILSFGTDLKNFTELLEKGLDFASKLKEVISGLVTTILKDIGQASLVSAGLLVVAYTLERVHDLSDNKDGCWALIKEMSRLASVVKGLKESPMGTLNVIEEATTLVVEGAIMCCTQIARSEWKR